MGPVVKRRSSGSKGKKAMSDANFQEGLNCLELGRLKDAEEIFLKYLEENPADAMAHNKLGVVYGKTQDLERAKSCFFKALEWDKNFVHAWNNLGNIARQEGDLEAAIQYYRNALAIDPENPIPRRNLKMAERHVKWSPKKLVNLFKRK